MNRKSSLFVLFAFAWVVPVAAQVPLTLDQMVDTLLAKNYSIRVMRINEKIAEVQNTPGAAGVYPSVFLLAGTEGSVTDTRQEFFNGDIREANAAFNNAMAFGVRADWTLFNGFYILSTREQLDLQEQFASVNTRLQVETELYLAASLYYEIKTREQLVTALENAMTLSRQRVVLAKTRLDIGRGNRLDYLQSLLDLNADSAAWLREKTEIKNLYTSLEASLSLEPGTGLVLMDSLVFSEMPALVDVMKEAETQNSNMLRLKILERQSLTGIRLTQSGRYPLVGVFGEYNFAQSQNAVGILKSNQGIGPAAGITLQYNLFNGSQVNRDIAVARLLNESAILQQEQGALQLRAELTRAYENYLLQKQLADFESDNVLTARENLRIAGQQLEQGSIDLFEFRDVQQAVMDAESRYLNALFGTKKAELDLLLLSGGLLRHFKAG